MNRVTDETFEKPDRMTWLRVNDFATRSFRDFADGDYIAARMHFRAHLVPQALWSSLQAIEKYLKCILVLNRLDTYGLGHQLQPALARIEQNLPYKLRLKSVSRSFIEFVDLLGPHRYFESCYHTFGLEIMQLDLTVWELRRYAQVLDYKIQTAHGPTSVLASELERLEHAEAKPHAYKIMGGMLESIIDNPRHPARGALVWQNIFFGKRHRKAARLTAHLHASNSPLSMHPEILDEVLKHAFIPQDVVNAYREVARDKAATADALAS